MSDDVIIERGKVEDCDDNEASVLLHLTLIPANSLLDIYQ